MSGLKPSFIIGRPKTDKIKSMAYIFGEPMRKYEVRLCL